MEPVCGPTAWHPCSKILLQLAKTAGFHSCKGLWHCPTIPKHCLWKSVPLVMNGVWSLQCILLVYCMKIVSEAVCADISVFSFSFGNFFWSSNYQSSKIHYQLPELELAWCTFLVLILSDKCNLTIDEERQSKVLSMDMETKEGRLNQWKVQRKWQSEEDNQECKIKMLAFPEDFASKAQWR